MDAIFAGFHAAGEFEYLFGEGISWVDHVGEAADVLAVLVGVHELVHLLVFGEDGLMLRFARYYGGVQLLVLVEHCFVSGSQLLQFGFLSAHKCLGFRRYLCGIGWFEGNGRLFLAETLVIPAILLLLVGIILVRSRSPMRVGLLLGDLLEGKIASNEVIGLHYYADHRFCLIPGLGFLQNFVDYK